MTMLFIKLAYLFIEGMIMDALQAILTRRSVRRFNPQPISDDVVDSILHAAMSAPSAVNEQPWHFLVINERKLLDKIADVHPHATMCTQAAAVIIPCIDTAQENYRDFWVQDMAAATENTLLAARSLGLGSVWVGVYPDEDRMKGIRQLFNLRDSVVPFAIIPLGYTDVPQEEMKERFKKERIHLNKW
jgi:nitroreductase